MHLVTQPSDYADYVNLIFMILSHIMLPPALLCTKSSGMKTDKLTNEVQKLKEEYREQRSRVIKLMGEVKANENYLDKKRQELAKLNIAYRNAQQESAQRDLTEVHNHLKELEKNIASIKRDILDGEEEQAQLITRIVEAQRQLKDTKEHIEKCLKSLKGEIEYLEFEKTVKLQEYDHRNAPRTQPEPQEAGSGLGIATWAAGVLRGFGNAIAIGWLLYCGL